MDEIALLNTVLVRWDGARLYCPNARLSADHLVNLSRSSKKGEALKVRSPLRWLVPCGQHPQQLFGQHGSPCRHGPGICAAQ